MKDFSDMFRTNGELLTAAVHELDRLLQHPNKDDPQWWKLVLEGLLLLEKHARQVRERADKAARHGLTFPDHPETN